MKTYILLVVLFLTSFSEAIENVDSDLAPESKAQVKLNNIDEAHVEVLLGASSDGMSLTGSWFLNSKLLLGIQSKRVAHISQTSGGDLDAGQYYMTSRGYRAEGVSLNAKYFFKDQGAQVRGFFALAQIGRTWGQYELSQERYSRNQDFITGSLLGIDKKIEESSGDSARKDANLLRAGIGYTYPFMAGKLFKGVAFQGAAGVEDNSLPDSYYLNTKFGSQNVASSAKRSIFIEAAIATYF